MAAPAAAGAEGVIRAEKRGRVVVWTMNNPQKLNCLNIAMITRMGQLFEEASVDPTVDAAILTGTGRYFSSGAAFGDVGLPKTLRLSTLHAAVASLNGECTQASISVCCSCTCRCTCRLRQSTVWGRWWAMGVWGAALLLLLLLLLLLQWASSSLSLPSRNLFSSLLTDRQWEGLPQCSCCATLWSACKVPI
jgi:hypothetical protein